MVARPPEYMTDTATARRSCRPTFRLFCILPAAVLRRIRLRSIAANQAHAHLKSSLQPAMSDIPLESYPERTARSRSIAFRSGRAKLGGISTTSLRQVSLSKPA